MAPADTQLVGFKRHLQAVTVPAEAVYLLSTRGITALAGASIEELVPLLDGTRTVAQVKDQLSSHLSAGEVDQLIGHLTQADLISFRRSPPATGCDGAAEAYWDSAGIDADDAASALASAAVRVVALGEVDERAAVTACRASGLNAAPSGGAPALTLVLCEDYLDPALRDVNSAHLASGHSWLLAKPSGTDMWVGPVFQPGLGACWECLAKRLAGNRHGEFLIRRVLGGCGPARHAAASLPVIQAAALQLAVLEATKWLAGYRSEHQLGIRVLDSLNLSCDCHPVARRPQCPACGDPGLVARLTREPVRCSARRIAGRDGNGLRALPLDRVLQQYGHLVDPVTGIVSELRRDPRSPEFLPAYVSGRNHAMAANNVAAVKAGLRSHSGGKGTTEMEAKVGALCEAVERYCATREGDELTVRDSFLGLGAQAVHPDTCQLFDQRQFADRARWNAVSSPFHRVPEPFNDRAVIDWTPVWSLLSDAQRLLPTAMLYFDPAAGGALVSVRADSNGNAAGSSLEDAILHGFFELVERDAVALWWYNRTRHPGVDLDSFGDPWVAGLADRYRGLNRELWALDVTSDLGIPVMAAISRRTDKAAEDIMFGFGAHADPNIALRRALTELGQLLPAVADAGPDGAGYQTEDPHLTSWWTCATAGNQPYLRTGPDQADRTAASYGYTASEHVDLSSIRAIARRADLDILVLNQTRPDINMPVVKVVVPGLRHFWPRFAPGRLYETPVHLGRLAEPTPYEELNPIPLFV